MIILQTWRRFVNYWPALLPAGLFATLLFEVVRVVAAVTLRPLAPEWATYTVALEGTESPAAWAPLLGLPLRSLPGLAVCLAVLLVVAPLAQGGLAHVVARVLRDEPVAAREFWTAALRFWRPLFGLWLIAAGVGAGLLALGLVMSLVPLLGPLVWLIGASMVVVALCCQGPYLVVAEGLGAREAATKAFRMLNLKLLDLFVTVDQLLLVALVMGLVTAPFSLSPAWQLVVNVALNTLWLALVPLYLAVRYQTNIAPVLTPPGGTGSFHTPHPPAGA